MRYPLSLIRTGYAAGSVPLAVSSSNTFLLFYFVNILPRKVDRIVFEERVMKFLCLSEVFDHLVADSAEEREGSKELEGKMVTSASFWISHSNAVCMYHSPLIKVKNTIKFNSGSRWGNRSFICWESMSLYPICLLDNKYISKNENNKQCDKHLFI